MTRTLIEITRLSQVAALATAFLLSSYQVALSIDFDSSFGAAGKFTTSFADSGAPSSWGGQVFVQSSGRVVVVGSHFQQGTISRTGGVAIVGLTPAGVLDNTFGTGGKILLWSPSFQRYHLNSIMLGDGSILVFCQIWESEFSNRPVIVKFTADGQPDPSFTATLDPFPNQTSPIMIANAAGGKIYAVVRSFTFEFALIRLNPDGSRDTTFGPNGIRSLNLNRFTDRPDIFGLLELADGRLLIAGNYFYPGSFGETFIARLYSNATIDRSFGLQGAIRLKLPGGGLSGYLMRLQPDGKILIGGSWGPLGSSATLVRLTPRGRLDTGFGNGGIAMATFNQTNGIRGIAIASDGKLVVTGVSGEKAIPSNLRFFVMRYSAAGIQEGSLVTNFSGNREAGATDVALQPDGKILISAFAQNPIDNNYQLAAARFVP